MARPPSRRVPYLRLSYYTRKPARVAMVFLIFAAVSFLYWDRQTLSQRHQEDVAKLLEEKGDLLLELKTLQNAIVSKAIDNQMIDSDDKYFHEFENDKEEGLEVDESQSKPVRHRRSPILQAHVGLDGLKEPPADPDPLASERRDKIRGAMVHAWSSYEKYAWGFDELLPRSEQGSNQFGGFGATIIDSLDTLFIMGLHDEFEKATDWVATSLDFNKHYVASVFETSIRMLGGLISSYDMSGNKLFLTKALELADRLLPAWETPSGIPMTFVDLASGTTSNPGWTGGSSVLADLGTEQLELIALSERTGVSKYREKAEKVILKLRENYPADGLLPIFISPQTGRPTTQKITFGAMGDSFYEYLLKAWIQGNKTDVVQHYRDMWEQSMEGLITLVRKSNPSSYVYIVERFGDHSDNKMDELACFVPGMLALGAGGASPEKASQYLEIAKGLARTCYNFYTSTYSHLAGENYYFKDGVDMTVGTAYNILRPETIESLFYLWRVTGDGKYREWGWDIFQAFESNSRIATGYVGLRDVNSGEKDDKMQTFFLAETLKYLYLLFSPSSVVSLDEWVFNTEAHPIRIQTRRQGAHYTESQSREEGRREDSGDKNQKRSGRSHLPSKILREGRKGGTEGPFDYS